MKRTAYLLLTATIILLSFFLYASRFYPLLNSDDALNILMTFYYKLPRDLYCWGQDRGGTLIPLLGQIFYRGAGVSPVLAVSLANYLLLIAGFAGFASLLEKKTSRLLLAAGWFLPPFFFIDMTRFPLGMEYSLIGFSLLLIGRLVKTSRKALSWHALMLSLVVVLTAALWVSDTAVITIVLLLVTLALAHRRSAGTFRPPAGVLAWTAGGALAAGLFLRYARSFVTHTTGDYLQINTFPQIAGSLHILASRLGLLLTFHRGEPLLSLFTWGALLLLLLAVLLLVKGRVRLTLQSRYRLLFFAADALAMGGVVLFSHWVFLNGLGSWYFVPLYIDLLLFTLLLLDHAVLPEKLSVLLRSAAAVTLLAGALSTPWHLRYVSPGSLRPEITLRREFLQMAPVGIIAGYWNAYITAAAAPDVIKATPHEGDKNRNISITEEVFEMPKILVIGDMWLDTFPDTLRQYGHTLIKKGDSFEMGGCRVQEYLER